MIVEPTTSTWFEAKCAQDVDAMLRRLEELGPNFKADKHGDDATYDTETSTVLNESSFEGNEEASVGAPVSDVSSDQEDHDRRTSAGVDLGVSTEHEHDDDEDDDTNDDELEGLPVQFVNMGLKREDALPSQQELQKLSNEELVELLEQMRERLAKSLVELSGERFIRRKKEKTLEKLAKELCKRVTEGEMKEKQIEEVRAWMWACQEMWSTEFQSLTCNTFRSRHSLLVV
jgi:hypothetical protein